MKSKTTFYYFSKYWCFLGKYCCQTHIRHSLLAKIAFCCLHCSMGCCGLGLWKCTGCYSATGSRSMGLSRHHRSAAVKRDSFIYLFSHHNLCTCSLVCPSPQFPQISLLIHSTHREEYSQRSALPDPRFFGRRLNSSPGCPSW